MNARTWLSHYDPGVPHSLTPYPERTLLDVFADTVRTRPDADLAARQRWMQWVFEVLRGIVPSCTRS